MGVTTYPKWSWSLKLQYTYIVKQINLIELVLLIWCAWVNLVSLGMMDQPQLHELTHVW